jgi:integrase
VDGSRDAGIPESACRPGLCGRSSDHYFASLLIASGADVKTVQARLRHASAKTTLDTYGHIWPDRDESTRAAVDAVITARTEQRRNSDEAASH